MSEPSETPAPIRGAPLKDKTPVAPVIPGSTPIPAKNTRTAYVGADGKAKATQPLQIPDDTMWFDGREVSKADPDVFKKGQTVKAVVTYVPDGDGAYIRVDGNKVLATRLGYIDAPETAKTKYGKSGQPYGEEAKKYLEKLIKNKEVNLTVIEGASEKNKFRPVVQIEVEGKNVNLEMVQAGAAWLHKTYGVPDEYRQAFYGARSERRGIFKDSEARTPGNFRALSPTSYDSKDD